MSSSSREPWWYCHKCRAEVRTVFIGSCPYCTICGSACVEQVDNPADDPRMWLATGENRGYLSARQDVMQARTRNAIYSLQPHRQTSHVGSTLLQGPSSFTLPHHGINATAGLRRPTFFPQFRTPTLFGPVGTSSPPDLRGMRDENGVGMPRHGLARPQQQVDRQEQTVSPSVENRLLGDYRSSQEALHQASSQMTGDSSMPETDEILERLPREELRAGSSLLGKLCAICLCHFSLDTEDPGEQVIVTLPCSHSFHEPCIVTWLKEKLTCPVCRYQIVLQRGSDNTDEIFVGGRDNNPRLPGSPGAIGFERNALHLSLSVGEGHEGNSTGNLGTPVNSTPFEPEPSNIRFDMNTANNVCGNPQEHGHGGWGDDMDID